MPDETTEIAGADAQGTDTTTATPPTGGASAAGLTQEQFNEALQKRLAQEKKKADAAQAALQAKLDEYTAAEEARKAAEMTELEKAQAAIKAAQDEANAAKANASAAQREAYIARKAADIPEAYQTRIAGETTDELDAAIAAAREAHKADQAAFAVQLAGMTPEQVMELFGDAAKPLAERLAGRPANIGAPSNAVGATGKQDDNTAGMTPLQKMLAERERERK